MYKVGSIGLYLSHYLAAALHITQSLSLARVRVLLKNHVGVAVYHDVAICVVEFAVGANIAVRCRTVEVGDEQCEALGLAVAPCKGILSVQSRSLFAILHVEFRAAAH